VKAKVIVWAIALILVLIFVIGNDEPMNLVFIKNFQVSKIVVILISLAIGFVAGLLVEGKKNAPAKKSAKSEEE